jgi:hypothetical protein
MNYSRRSKVILENIGSVTLLSLQQDVNGRICPAWVAIVLDSASVQLPPSLPPPDLRDGDTSVFLGPLEWRLVMAMSISY